MLLFISAKADFISCQKKKEEEIGFIIAGFISRFLSSACDNGVVEMVPRISELR